GFTPLGEIFDPVTNTWSALNKPASFNWINGDACSCVLPDGRVLLGAVLSPRTAIWDPKTDAWTEAGKGFGASANPTKVGVIDEESWALLPEGSVLTVQITGVPATEKYVPASDSWISSGNTPSTLTLSSLNDPVTGTNVNISE